jgi:hypothetical protein
MAQAEGNESRRSTRSEAVMDPAVAHRLARRAHVGQRGRFGEPVIEHVSRVAAAVPADARVTAWLHDLLELCPTKRAELRRHSLANVELAALELLTNAPGEPYDTYIRRIVDAPGPAGCLARIVKIADLDDHLAQPFIPSDAPPYAWARRLLLRSPEMASRLATVNVGQVICQ